MGYIRNVLDYLRASARRLPDKAAFLDGRDSYTFGQLWEQSRRAGTAVARLAVQADRPVAALVDRSARSVLLLLAALQAGCYYVPLDRKMPRERLMGILAQLEPAAVLYAREDGAPPALEGLPLLAVEDAVETDPDEGLLEGRLERVLDADPAYMIFTSGSTGSPKGILVSHRSVIDFTEWMAETCGPEEGDVLANQAPFYFDLSVKDLYQTLRTGCTCHILPQKFFMFPLLLVRYLKEQGVTTLIWATSAFRLVAGSGALEKEPPESVRRVVLGGEALQASHLNIWRRALPGCRFVNLYGPTEVTVDCTWFPVEEEYADGETVPIGKPCRNKEIYLLDEELRPVPDGQPGEICVRGTGLALGYFRDWDKTSAAFVQNPMHPHWPERIYRTGDLARRDERGNLVFLARKDDQIKHMGYRIELGEIETALSGVAGVEAAVCFFDGGRDKIVCAYQGQAEEGDIAKALGEKVPRYMQPNLYRRYAALPMNANGKIDRVALKKEYQDAAG